MFERLGRPLPARYEEARAVIEAALPRDAAMWNEYHALLVEHGKLHCRKQPRCEGCPLTGMCRFARKQKQTT